MALLRIRMPSRWRASRLAWRWWEVRRLEESSVGERVMDVIEEGGGVAVALRVEAGILLASGGSWEYRRSQFCRWEGLLTYIHLPPSFWGLSSEVALTNGRGCHSRLILAAPASPTPTSAEDLNHFLFAQIINGSPRWSQSYEIEALGRLECE